MYVVRTACVICVVKFKRVSDSKGSRPKLYRISPEDSDIAEFAAWAIAIGTKVSAQMANARRVTLPRAS